LCSPRRRLGEVTTDQLHATTDISRSATWHSGGNYRPAAGAKSLARPQRCASMMPRCEMRPLEPVPEV
jgi:hypothetical protein